ncbi:MULTISPECIES: hypothetical protein [Cyanophyceae]|nr:MULTISPECIES: hypothetical protein [unclassified Trichocoleus]
MVLFIYKRLWEFPQKLDTAGSSDRYLLDFSTIPRNTRRRSA